MLRGRSAWLGHELDRCLHPHVQHHGSGRTVRRYDASFGHSGSSPLIESGPYRLLHFVVGVQLRALLHGVEAPVALKPLWRDIEARTYAGFDPWAPYCSVALFLFFRIRSTASFWASRCAMPHSMWCRVATTTGYASCRLCPMAPVRTGAHAVPQRIRHMRRVPRVAASSSSVPS